MPRNTEDWTPKDKRVFGTGSISYVQAHQRWQGRIKGALDIYASTKGKTRAAYKEVEAKLNFIVEKRRQTGMNKEYRYTKLTVLEYARLHVDRPWGKKMTPLSPATVDTRHTLIRLLEKHDVAFVGMNDLRAKHIEALVSSLQKSGYESWSNIAIMLKSLCNHAARNQDINRETNPAIDIKIGTQVRVIEKERVWSQEEMVKFQRHVSNDPLYGPLFTVMGETGLRIGELHGLRNCDVFLDDPAPHLKVVQTAIRNSSTGGFSVLEINKDDKSRRTIYLYPTSAQLMREYRARKTKWKGPEDFFWNGTPKKSTAKSKTTGELIPNTVRRMIKKYASLAGVRPLTPHEFRHTHLSRLVNDGASIKAVQVRAGHASAETTLRTYVHSTDADQRALVSQMSSPGTNGVSE